MDVIVKDPGEEAAVYDRRFLWRVKDAGVSERTWNRTVLSGKL